MYTVHTRWYGVDMRVRPCPCHWAVGTTPGRWARTRPDRGSQYPLLILVYLKIATLFIETNVPVALGVELHAPEMGVALGVLRHRHLAVKWLRTLHDTVGGLG